MAIVATQSSLEESIRRAINERIREIIQEETDKAIAAVGKRIATEADRLALGMMKHYEVHNAGDRLVIEVKKP